MKKRKPFSLPPADAEDPGTVRKARSVEKGIAEKQQRCSCQPGQCSKVHARVY